MKMLLKRISWAVIFAVAALAVWLHGCNGDGGTGPSPGNVYYVATNGDDNNTGTETQPWLTITKAANTLVAGDTVYIKAGTYNERVIPQNSGTAGNYITYAADNGAVVTVDGTGINLPNDWGGLFDISGRSYIKVSGLRITNAGPNNNNVGILVDESSYVTIEKNYTYNTVSSGIAVWGSDNVIVDGNEVVLACNDGEQECITVAGTNGFEIKNNHVHDSGPGTIGGEGIDAKDGSVNGKIFNNHVHDINRLGIYMDAWDKNTGNFEVYGNKIHDCNPDGFTLASEAGGRLHDIEVYNNLIYDNGDLGIGIYDYGEPGVTAHPIEDVSIINNTFYNNGRAAWGGGIGIDNNDAKDIVIRNNICSGNLSFQIAVEKGDMNEITVDHNLIDGFRGYEGELRGDDYVEGDPKFVNQTSRDLHLQGDSPAIDKGSPNSAPNSDYDGNSRPRGAGFDIGAYEYQG